MNRPLDGKVCLLGGPVTTLCEAVLRKLRGLLQGHYPGASGGRREQDALQALKAHHFCCQKFSTWNASRWAHGGGTPWELDSVSSPRRSMDRTVAQEPSNAISASGGGGGPTQTAEAPTLCVNRLESSIRGAGSYALEGACVGPSTSKGPAVDLAEASIALWAAAKANALARSTSAASAVSSGGP